MKTSKKNISIAVGTALGASLALSPIALAGTNPFAAAELPGGYMQIAGGHGEGGCGEGKCGSEKDTNEGTCGSEKDHGEGKSSGEEKDGEGSCGAA